MEECKGAEVCLSDVVPRAWVGVGVDKGDEGVVGDATLDSKHVVKRSKTKSRTKIEKHCIRITKFGHSIT